MSMAQRILEPEPIEVSAEAKKRLTSARALDISFVVKQRIGSEAPEDVQMLVEMILDATDKDEPLTSEFVKTYLRRRGRSPLKSEQLARALFTSL